MTKEELNEMLKGPSILETKEECTNAYKNLSLSEDSEDLAGAGLKCEKAMEKLSSYKREQICLDARNNIRNILNSEVVNNEIMAYAKYIINGLCDAYAMYYAKKKCFSHGSIASDSLLKSKKSLNTKCKDALNFLSDELKQEFCLHYRNGVLRAVIERICNNFLSHLNAKANGTCIEAYKDAIWYEIPQSELLQIDINCRKAVENYYGQNKEDFCEAFPKRAELSLVDTENIADKKIISRAVDAVKDACEMTPVENAMNACINDHFDKYIHANFNEILQDCKTAIEKLDAEGNEKFCLQYNNESLAFLGNLSSSFVQQAESFFYLTPTILRKTKEVVKNYCGVNNLKKNKLDSILEEIKSSNEVNEITPKAIANVQLDVQSKIQPSQSSYGFFNSSNGTIDVNSYNVTSEIKMMLN
ncbi:MAG: hypothetical protein REH83_04155 [Rickettsiella sp.]|nr:hypothetical protein [Rickettsiella sp.]